IEVASEDPRLWSNRAKTFIKLGYSDAINALSLIVPKIISGKYDDTDLVLLCKSGWRKAEALAKSDEYQLAARELERLSRISVGSDRYIVIGKICKFPSRESYPWDIRSQEHCTEEKREFGTKDIKKGTILLDEKPFISVHAPDQQQCDFATNQLVRKISLARNQIVWKSFYEIVNKDSKFSGSSLLFVLKIFAIAKQRDIGPSDIEEIKHLFTFQHSTSWKTKPNCNLLNPMTGPGQMYPTISLFNHHCDPNACLSEEMGNDLSISSVVGNTTQTRQLLETTYGTYIEYLFEALELKDPAKRSSSSMETFVYRSRTFGELTNPEEQLEWIKENNK
ncbi:7272_t:CDS:2, partial [Diversispora eburnea]